MIIEIAPPDTAMAYAAMRELRPAFTDVDRLVEQIDDVQRPQGYRLVGFIPEGTDRVVSVAGFRQLTSLSWGRYLYVDDLSTLESDRGRGFAGRLLGWIASEAQRLDCAAVHLDSGVGPERWPAHRVYLNAGFGITAHHFCRDLDRAAAR